MTKTESNTTVKFNKDEMDTIARAIRLLARAGLLDQQVGETVIAGIPNVGPLTPATRKDGSETFLLADSGITVDADRLRFRMTIPT